MIDTMVHQCTQQELLQQNGPLRVAKLSVPVSQQCSNIVTLILYPDPATIWQQTLRNAIQPLIKCIQAEKGCRRNIEV